MVPNNVVPLNRFVVNCTLGAGGTTNKPNTSQEPGHGTDTGFDVKAICRVFSAGFTIKVSANTDGHVKAIKLVQARPMRFTSRRGCFPFFPFMTSLPLSCVSVLTAGTLHLHAISRHSPDDSRTGVNSSDFLASLEARRGVMFWPTHAVARMVGTHSPGSGESGIKAGAAICALMSTRPNVFRPNVFAQMCDQ